MQKMQKLDTGDLDFLADLFLVGGKLIKLGLRVKFTLIIVRLVAGKFAPVFEAMRKAYNNSENLGRAIRGQAGLPDFIPSMVSIGSERGPLDEAFIRISLFLRDMERWEDKPQPDQERLYFWNVVALLLGSGLDLEGSIVRAGDPGLAQEFVTNSHSSKPRGEILADIIANHRLGNEPEPYLCGFNLLLFEGTSEPHELLAAVQTICDELELV